jgi:FMN-dependent oxidoreductase (nitrilotriacetate monooxygenase family)
MTARRQLHLGLFTYPGGHHIAGWRHPSVDTSAIAGADFYAQSARTAERGKFDLIFVGDMLAAREQDGRIIAEGGLNNIDSISITSMVSAVTERLGLVATLSTTYNEPFTVAGRFASLDHISGGRAGWNIVTTQNDAAAYNFSQPQHMAKPRRYERAREFVDVCTKLWASWDDNALPLDRAAGRFMDPSKIHPINHRGEFFSVRGPAALPRPPQGWPVLVQAGGSPEGMEFAASVAEVIFAAQGDMAAGVRFRSAIHARMAALGRPPGALKVLPGLSPVLGSTEREARLKEEELDALVAPAVAVWALSDHMKFRLKDYPIDGKLPVADIRAAWTSSFTPRVAALLDRAEQTGLSIREAATEVARTRSHGSFVGTPEQLADHMAHWLDEGACDGFNIMPPYFPAELDLFVNEVVPVLQRRGLFRREYEAETLRGHLGLETPGRGPRAA